MACGSAMQPTDSPPAIAKVQPVHRLRRRNMRPQEARRPRIQHHRPALQRCHALDTDEAGWVARQDPDPPAPDGLRASPPATGGPAGLAGPVMNREPARASSQDASLGFITHADP